MLPEIIISCETAGLIYINNSCLGEVNDNTYQSFIGAGVFYLKYIPFSSEKIYSPLCIKISISDDAPVFDSPYLHIFNCKNNVFLLELSPPPLAGHTLPVCLGFAVADNRFTVSLVEQNCFYLVIEDEQKEFADSFFPLDFNATPYIEMINVNNSAIILLSDNKSRIYAFCKNENKFQKALTLDADSWKQDDKYIIITKTTSNGHKVINSYTVENNRILLKDTSFNINPAFDNDIVTDFLECIKYGIKSKALSYLSSDLSLSFEELRDFLGEFTHFKKSPFEQNAFALISQNKSGNSALNRFSFEIKSGKIYNIQEL